MSGGRRDVVLRGGAEVIRRFRIKRGLSLSELEARAGVSKATISVVERGKADPGFTVVVALARALRIPFSEFEHLKKELS